jgi:hypothetical protein
LVFVSIFDGEFEFSFFGPQYHRLPLHAADHIEGGFGFPAQRHLEQVFLDAGFDGRAQFGGDFEETIRRAQALDALVRSFVIIVFYPEPDAFAGGVEALELGAGKELLPDGLPEAFDFPQRHGMMRAGLEMVGPVLFHLGLEAGDTPPVDVLPAVVGEHLPGRLVFARRHPEDFQNVFRGVAPKEVRPDDEARIIIHESDHVGVTPAEPEGEDIRLPHLVRRGPLKETGTDQVASRLGRRLNQSLFLEGRANGLRAGLQEEHPFEQLGYSFDAPGRFLLLKLQDLFPDGLGEFGPGTAIALVLQTLLPVEAV